jgi:hypothetical protein
MIKSCVVISAISHLTHLLTLLVQRVSAHNTWPYLCIYILNCNEELNNVYSSPDITRLFKSRRLRWAGHAASMGSKRNAYRFLLGKTERKRPLDRPRRKLEIIIKSILQKSDGLVRSGFSWYMIGSSGGFL